MTATSKLADLREQIHRLLELADEIEAALDRAKENSK